eukprot:scaffold9449_cov82-Skeletonema_menzelii.AAC.1
MSMRRHHRRLRLLQRRYARKGRRKAPPDRPPGGLKLKPPRKHPRTYNFNTYPPTGATLSQSDYTLYIHSTALTLYDKRLTRIIQNKKYLRQQRMLYYQEIGLRYKHTLPKHESQKNQKPSQAAQQLSDQLQDQLADYYLPTPTTYDSNLPPDPSHWAIRPPSFTRNSFPPTLLPPNPPVFQHFYAKHVLITRLTRTFLCKKLKKRNPPKPSSNSNVHSIFGDAFLIMGFFFLIGISLYKVLTQYTAPTFLASGTESTHHMTAIPSTPSPIGYKHAINPFSSSSIQENNPNSTNSIISTYFTPRQIHLTKHPFSSHTFVEQKVCIEYLRKTTYYFTQPFTIICLHTPAAMPSESQEESANPLGEMDSLHSTNSPMEDDLISEGDINRSKDKESTQPTSNISTTNPTLPTANTSNPDVIALLQQLLAAQTKTQEHQDNLSNRLTALEQQETTNSTIPTSIKSPSTTTTATTMNSNPTKHTTLPPFPSKPSYAAAASSTKKSSNPYPRMPHYNKPTDASSVTSATSTMNPVPANPPSNIWTTVTRGQNKAPKTSFLRSLQSSQLSTNQGQATDTSHIDFGPAIDQEIASFDPRVTVTCKVSNEAFAIIFQNHREELQDVDIGTTLQENFNRLLLSQFPQDHHLFGVLVCTKVDEDTTVPTDSYNITFDIAQTHVPVTTDYIYRAHYALLDMLQTLSITMNSLRHGLDPTAATSAQYWMDAGFSALLGAIELESHPLIGTTPHCIALVSENLQAREFNQLDKQAQHFFIQQFVAGCAAIDPTGSFQQLADKPVLLLRHLTLRALSFPNPKYQPRRPTSRSNSNRANSKSKFFEKRTNSVATIVTSNTPFGRAVTKALLRLLYNHTTATATPLKIPNRSTTLKFQPIPIESEKRAELYESIYNNQAKCTIHLVRNLPIGYAHIANIHSTHLKHHPAIEAINPSFLHDREVGTTSLHIRMNSTLQARALAKETIQQELSDTYNRLTSTTNEEPSTEEQPSPNQEPVQNTNPLNIDNIYGGDQVLFRSNEKWWVVFWGKGGNYLTVTNSYPIAIEKVFEVSFNHHLVFPSQTAAFQALSEVYAKQFDSMEDVEKYNFRIPLYRNNAQTEHAPRCLQHLHQRKNRDSYIINYHAPPTTDEELVHRYQASNRGERRQFRDSSSFRKLPKSTTHILDCIDAAQHPLSPENITTMILATINESDQFSFSEHSPYVNQANNPSTTTQANQEETIPVSASKDSSLDLQSDQMSISSTNNVEYHPHQDSQEYFVPSQDQNAQDQDTPNKRMRQSSPSTTPPNHAQLHLMSPTFRNDNWCLITAIPPFISLQDCKFIMRSHGLYNELNEPIGFKVALKSVHLCQYKTFTNDEMPTHAVWVCNSENGYNDIARVTAQIGILNHTSSFTKRLGPTDSLKVLPPDTDLEEPEPMAKMWKWNCPEGQEEALYYHIKTKDHAALCNWINIYSGKMAHSL